MKDKLLQFFNLQQSLKKSAALFFVAAIVVIVGWLGANFKPLYVAGFLAAIFLALQIFYRPFYGVLLLTFFLPFERLGSYDFSGITIRPSQITVLLTIISLFFLTLRRRQTQLPRFPIALPLLFFVIISLFGLLNAENIIRSVVVLLFIIFTFTISLILPLLVKNTKQLERLLKFFFASMVLVSFFGIFQFIGDLTGLSDSVTGLRDLYTKEVLGFPRVQSTALEPLYFANYLLIPISLLFSFFLINHKFQKYRSHLLLIPLGLGVLNLLLTVARGGYIALGVSLFVVAALHLNRLFSVRNFLAFTIPLVIIFFLGWSILGTETITETTTDFTSHMQNIFGGASYAERRETFTLALNAWREHPLVGIGAGGFGPYTSVHPFLIPMHGWKIVNNIYLELLAEHGVLGLATMLAVFFLLIIRSVKALVVCKDSFLYAALTGFLAAFIGILVQYNTFSILYIVHIWFTIGMLITLQNMILEKNGKLTSS